MAGESAAAQPSKQRVLAVAPRLSFLNGGLMRMFGKTYGVMQGSIDGFGVSL